MKCSELIEKLRLELQHRGDIEVLATGDSSIDWCEIDGVFRGAQLEGKDVVVIEVGDSI